MTLDPFGKGKKADVIVYSVFEEDKLVDELLSQYRKTMSNVIMDNIISYINKFEFEILNPSQINNAAQRIITEEDSDYKGLFISKLIQDSYNSGFNDFILTTRDNWIDYLCYGLDGKEDNLLNLTLHGIAGTHFFAYSTNSIITIDGDVGMFCGYSCTNLYFKTPNNSIYKKLREMVGIFNHVELIK